MKDERRRGVEAAVSAAGNANAEIRGPESEGGMKVGTSEGGKVGRNYEVGRKNYEVGEV